VLVDACEVLLHNLIFHRYRSHLQTVPRFMIKEMPITFLLLIANGIVSYLGFRDPAFMEKYVFNVNKILVHKEYYRLVTKGFLHADLSHLVMNLMSLYFMGEYLEVMYHVAYGPMGMLAYLTVYFGSLLGGDALALLMQRNNGQYSSLGASGAISGVIFAALVISPSMTLYMFAFIPMPFWLYAVLFTGYSLFGIRTRHGNIGHEAHLGGALFGLVLGALFMMSAAIKHWVFLTALALPPVGILTLFYFNPAIAANPWAWIKSFKFGGGGTPQNRSRTQANASGNPYSGPVKQDGLEVNRRAMMQKELDDLLERVSKKGYHSLSQADKDRLDQLGRELNRNTNMGGGRAPSA
jgi:membrane associated rhomboid family serine protease